MFVRDFFLKISKLTTKAEMYGTVFLFRSWIKRLLYTNLAHEYKDFFFFKSFHAKQKREESHIYKIESYLFARNVTTIGFNYPRILYLRHFGRLIFLNNEVWIECLQVTCQHFCDRHFRGIFGFGYAYVHANAVNVKHDLGSDQLVLWDSLTLDLHCAS